MSTMKGRFLCRNYWVFLGALFATDIVVQLNSQMQVIPSLVQGHSLIFQNQTVATGMAIATNESVSNRDHYYTASVACTFRDYDFDSGRFYGLISGGHPKPFLRNAFYIHGKPPVLLPIMEPLSGGKLCRHPTSEELVQTRSEISTDQTRPMSMDGTNPSLVSLERLHPAKSYSRSAAAAWKRLLERHDSAVYVISSTFKVNHQCNYGEGSGRTVSEIKKQHNQLLPGRHFKKEADIFIVDSNYQVLLQTHIWDASTMDENSTATHFSADDARLFVHDGSLWITYKGYTPVEDARVQFVNRIHLEYSNDPSSFRFLAHPEETLKLYDGRNFAALTERQQETPSSMSLEQRSLVDDSKPWDPKNSRGQLSFLTWPDPVWVQSLNTRHGVPHSRNIHLANPIASSSMSNKKPSQFHGTSNQLIYVPETDEYFGVGHIHRERKWIKAKRKDAAYGHHYTHAFFTISAHEPYHLKRLSQEFVFPSKVRGYSNDADVIQFASGLEWVTTGVPPTVPRERSSISDTASIRRAIAIAYGINDCEGAVVHVGWDVVDSLLRPVKEGTQVAHVMANVSREDFA